MRVVGLLLAAVVGTSSCSSCGGTGASSSGTSSVAATDAGSADAGPPDGGACVFSEGQNPCGCCLDGIRVVCPQGVVGVPNAGSITLPACGQ